MVFLAQILTNNRAMHLSTVTGHFAIATHPETGAELMNYSMSYCKQDAMLITPFLHYRLPLNLKASVTLYTILKPSPVGIAPMIKESTLKLVTRKSLLKRPPAESRWVGSELKVLLQLTGRDSSCAFSCSRSS